MTLFNCTEFSDSGESGEPDDSDLNDDKPWKTMKNYGKKRWKMMKTDDKRWKATVLVALSIICSYFSKKKLFYSFQLFPLLTTVNNIVFIIIYILQRVRSPVLVALSIICSGAKPPILDIITASKTIMFHRHYHHVICTAERCS